MPDPVFVALLTILHLRARVALRVQLRAISLPQELAVQHDRLDRLAIPTARPRLGP